MCNNENKSYKKSSAATCIIEKEKSKNKELKARKAFHKWESGDSW